MGTDKNIKLHIVTDIKQKTQKYHMDENDNFSFWLFIRL